MKTSEPITLFQNFVELLVAVLTHPQTPAIALEYFQTAAVAFVSESCGYAPDVAALRPALLRAFSAHLAGTVRPGLTADDQQACRELGKAVATFERYRDFLPEKVYGQFADSLNIWQMEMQWQGNPALVEQILPLLFAQQLQTKGVQ